MILGIYGAGGLGREVYELATIINSKDHRWDTIIFIDDSSNPDNPRNLTINTFSEVKKISNMKDIEVCIAVGEPFVRETLYKRLDSDGIKMATLIHPEVNIPESTQIGKGVIICNLFTTKIYIIISSSNDIKTSAFSFI